MRKHVNENINRQMDNINGQMEYAVKERVEKELSIGGQTNTFKRNSLNSLDLLKIDMTIRWIWTMDRSD